MYSFDIFDTLITRTTATPWGIFALMREKMAEEQQQNQLESYVIDNFYELRIHSEELARKAGVFQRREEVTLEDIYAAMAVCGCISREQQDYLYCLEQKTEIANVVGITQNIDKLKAIVDSGERVVLVSDMYLPEETIRKMLLQIDEIFETLTIYVSSEYGRRKTTGNLYRLVQKLENISFEQWTHVGDNIRQDIEIPLQLGLNVELFRRAELNEFEKDLLEKYGDDHALQLMIGAAIGLKWEKPETEDWKGDAYQIGSRYAGAVLYSYAEWVVDQAIKRSLKRLYFIARDGFLVKEIVDVILSERKADISTAYIYGSRKAWRMPSLSREHYNLYQLILWSHANRIVNLRELASTMNVSVQELYRFLPGAYAKDRENDHITNVELEYIVRKLAADDEFIDFHLQNLKEKRNLAIRYLDQEIDTSDDKFAFVDVSGGGLTQGCLRQLLNDKYPKPIHTFFFKIDRVNLVEGSITDTFIPSFLESNLTVEMMCRAPHGQTEGYRLEDGKVVPVLSKTESEALIRHGFYEYEKGILDFSRRMCQVSVRTGVHTENMKNVLLYLRQIAESPSKEVLEYFASMPSSESGRGGEVLEYAPKLTKEDIRNIFLLRTDEPVEFFYKGTDLNYSVMRASEEEKRLIERCKAERNGVIGIIYRRQGEQKWKELRSRYGSAAFYPIRLLEEKIILYGAGRFGQNLYRKLIDSKDHEIVLWVDKNAESCKKQGLKDVRKVSEIEKVSYDQIVIAVIDKGVASEIMEDLQAMGIVREKIIWLPCPGSLAVKGEWKSEGIG